MLKNPKLLILGLIMLVNALSYGTIIPLLYPYASRFGVNALTLSWLFASFSIAQFIATPIIGRLSDSFGRKPLLLLSLLGTSLSLALFASAGNVVMLFVSRILDGITGGNISVAQAVIADSTEGKDRTKAFGLLGAAFGFGFLFGPALGGILSQVNLSAPFWFASLVALIGSILIFFFLEETLPKDAKTSNQPLFPVKSLAQALFSPLTGIILTMTLLVTAAFNAWIIGFQTTTVDILHLSARDAGLIYAGAGLMTVLMQAVGIQWLLKIFNHKKTILVYSLLFCVVGLAAFIFIHTFWPFVIACLIFILSFAPVNPMVTGLISERTKAEDQGGILGINQSYVSIGQIIGPLIAGVVATFSVSYIYVLGVFLLLLSLIASRWLYIDTKEQLDL